MGPATADDVGALTRVFNDSADRLTSEFGRGPWSSHVTDRGVQRALAESRVVVARVNGVAVGTLRLQTRKPWAIDTTYFTPATAPAYLTGMAVAPEFQRQGIGRRLLEEAVAIARAWPRDVLRLDAWDAAAGAGAFYARCGWIERGRATYRNNPLVYFEFLTGA